MADLSVTVDGLKLPNPFVIGSGPPGTNANVINKAFEEGWGAVIAKTISLDASKVINVAPRYARMRVGAKGSETIVGWQNIELISDRPFDTWIEEFKQVKQKYPDRILIASIMEEYNKDAWCEIVERCQDAGVDAFELNFSCPHGLPERKMGAAMGQDCEVLGTVCGWVNGVSKKPVWAKMTPNITHIEEPARAALRNGCEGIAAINTILCVMGVDLKTLRPEPTVEGYTTPGGYSCKAVRPIALRMVMECARMMNKEFPGRSLSAIGGVETGEDAAQFILLGGSTVQVCTGVMIHGYGLVKELCRGLSAFMDAKGFKTIEEFRGHSLQYFTTHADLVQRQASAKALEKAAAEGRVTKDTQWTGEKFVEQSNKLVAN
ncbi:MAG: NAD-dependent dihydropyrimidine dehydrogenase subunit PreA [Phycisphaerae bacterium]|nr:NAD-dependent dihydropyrimidine dehydrogenase subunit PreA [Phycisphaerae bacterium]MBN8596476.1 NAD-dependent dihydropyrimidine dehydrogenase subunit PreA [Planctomycetota bacterium]